MRTSTRWPTMARVFVASCTGLQKLSGEIGRPLCLVDAALDVDEAIRDLRARRHGCGVRWPGSFQSLDLERGWDDWDRFDLDRRSPILNQPFGASFLAGSILMPLPEALTLAEFRCQLAGALRHLRLQEVTVSASYLEERCDMFAEMVVHPRYSAPRAVEGDFRDAAICEDLYAIDPAEHAWRIYWTAVAARAAAGEGRSPLWR